MKKLYTLIITLFLTSITFAQAPEKMSFQAIVRDSGDNLVSSQPVGMQISILQTSATGTVVYLETQTPTTNINGLVTLEIGTGTVISGDFTTIDWSEDSYFIKTETDPTGGTNYTITGTSQLLSVPYALHAKTAESVIGVEEGKNILGSNGETDPNVAVLNPSEGDQWVNVITGESFIYQTGIWQASPSSFQITENIDDTTSSFQDGQVGPKLITPPAFDGIFVWNQDGTTGVWVPEQNIDGKNILGSTGSIDPNVDVFDPTEGDQWINSDTGASYVYQDGIWNELPKSAEYIGPWNAKTNTPTLSSGTGTKGNYYIISTEGSTSINGINHWEPGHWIIFNGTVWEKVDYTDPTLPGATYVKSVSADFGGFINQNKLYNEIEADFSITPNLLDVDRIDDTIYIVFDSALSGPEQTQLDFIISSHLGTDLDPAIILKTIGAYNTTMVIQSAQTANSTITLPDATTTLVGIDTSDNLTNKTIDAENNTIINIENDNIKVGAAIDATKIANGSVTNTEFQYLNGVTSNIQTQLDSNSGDVAGPVASTDNYIPRFDGTTGKLIQGPTSGQLSYDDAGGLISTGSKTGYMLNLTNLLSTGGGNGIKITGGEVAGDIALHIADQDDTFQLLEIEADQGFVSMGKTYAQTLTDNGIVYGLDNQHNGNAADINTQNGVYRIGGIDIANVAQTLTNKTLISPTNNIAANSLNSATTSINVSSATAPTSGQVLTATSGTSATWQSLSVPVYGSNFQEQSSDGQSSTTSTILQTKTSLTTASLPAGTYRLGYSFEVSNAANAVLTEVEVKLDGVIVAFPTSETDNDFKLFGGFVYQGLSGVITASISYKTQTMGTALIRRARLELWRVN